MLYADSYYKYKAEKGFETVLLPELSKFDRFLWKIKGYKVSKLPEDPELTNDTEEINEAIMTLKEKCIYYNPSKEAYYLVLSISDMIYGRYGDMVNPNHLEYYLNENFGTGLRFKIDNIIINSGYIRNYYLNEKELDKFELVKELTDEEFYPMKLLIESQYKYPEIVIDIHKHMKDVTDIVNEILIKEGEMKRLKKYIHTLEKKLFINMRGNEK